MHLKSTLVFALLFALQSSFAQVTILGKFLLGDTTQFHVLKTVRGDQLIGKVMAWTTESLVFQTTDGQDITFPILSAKSIEVVQRSSASRLSTSLFVLETMDGKRYYGYPTTIMPNRIIFDAGKAGTVRIWPSNVRSITNELLPVYDNVSFQNQYIIKDTKGKKTHGMLLGYEDGNVQYLSQKGMEVLKPLTSFTKLGLKKDRQPVLGHDRSLLLMPTGFGMKRKENEFRNLALGVNLFAFGLSDHVSIGGGFMSILPYADIKISYPLAERLHASIGGYLVVPGALGYHGFLSFGSRDYFLNVSFLRNYEIPSLQTESDFQNVSFGGSMRIGPRSRFILEYNLLTSRGVSPFGNGYDIFYENGFYNIFSWSYGYFSRRFRIETGIMGLGPIEGFCFGNCPDIHIPMPIVSFGVRF